MCSVALQKWRYRVDGCFLWSTGSWDVLAVYPESTSSEGSYFDPVVADIIARHNKKVNILWLTSSAPGLAAAPYQCSAGLEVHCCAQASACGYSTEQQFSLLNRCQML